MDIAPESSHERQQLEITALKSIYADDFLECPPPKAWKGAAKLQEFIIRVAHPDAEHASKVSLNLHVIFPKTYPVHAYPTFTIQQPKGLSPEDVTKLSAAIHSEVKLHHGTEMVFQIVTFAQDWLAAHINPPPEVQGSLATQMIQRASDEERARQAEAAAADAAASAHAAALAEAFDAQLRLHRQTHPSPRQNRERALSDATEVPESGSPTDSPPEGVEIGIEPEQEGVLVQRFEKEVQAHGARFRSVKLFHPRAECLGTTYIATPIAPVPSRANVELELYLATFPTAYYQTAQGRKKLHQLAGEAQRLVGLDHPGVVRVFAVRLSLPSAQANANIASVVLGGRVGAGAGAGGGAPQLAILMEPKPSLTLKDVLEDCDALREERAYDYLMQILNALHAIHSRDLVHRGLTVEHIGLAPPPPTSGSQTKVVKLCKPTYWVKLVDLHRSNPFVEGDAAAGVAGMEVPDGWRSRDTIDSTLIYTRSRDIHYVGIVLLQMVLGLDIMQRYTDVSEAVRSSNLPTTLQYCALNMLMPKKNSVSCLSLLSELQNEVAAQGAARTHTQAMSIPTPGALRTPMAKDNYGSSPEMEYIRPPPRAKQVSRWKEDWDELELLGRGAFGSVVKARNKVDGRIYAVKKVRLRAVKLDTKILREVNALSRLSHRYIVRYFTTWFELTEPTSTATSTVGSYSDNNSDDTASNSTAAGAMPALRRKRHLFSLSHKRLSGGGSSNDPFTIDLDDLSESRASSFPSIHFTGSGSQEVGDSDNDPEGETEVDLDGLLDGGAGANGGGRRGDAAMSVVPSTPVPVAMRTLYIQMEFVERQTLKERIAEGLSESEAWRLFQQIVEALVHMSSLGILHRDIKLTNIFIDGKGDCKVGDFGLATSSLAAVDPTDVSPHAVTMEADLTLEVGTKLYIAPEVQSRKKGPRDHTKADMYSLGVVFFEMNYSFSTGAERIAVIEDLRKVEVFFPGDWDPNRTRQKQIITWLLQHDPARRPSALELSQSNLMPPRIEDEYFKGALRMMSKPDSPHHQAVLASLFSQTTKDPMRGLLYDMEVEVPEHISLNGIVRDTLAAIFRLHGAVEMEPPLLMPVVEEEDIGSRAIFLDRHGEVVVLSDDALLPFARLAARSNTRRIKRFHIGDTYRANKVAGHPRVTKAAVFDFITVDVVNGPMISSAEALILINECLNSFPSLAQHYEIHISHSRIIELTLERIPEDLRPFVIETVKQPRSSWAQKRTMLLKNGLLRGIVDELEVLEDTDEDCDALVTRLEKVSPHFAGVVVPYVEDIKKTIQFAAVAGATHTMFFHPFMMMDRKGFFKDGPCFEVVRRNKRIDVLAVAGRYDNIIAHFTPPNSKVKNEPVCAVGLQISLEKILVALATFQAVSVKSLLKEQRSFGFWSPRRCDVFVVSYQHGQLSDRLEVAALLWRHNISADVMYESGLPDGEHENHFDLCNREGILFSVWPRPKSARRDQPAFRIKSILKGSEYDISRQELVPWLQHQIAEQKRIDASTSGAPSLSDAPQISSSSKDVTGNPDVQLLLPGDTKKQRKQTKQIFLDRAFETGVQIKSAFESGIPVVAVDVQPATFDALTRSSSWVTEDDVWKTVSATFPTQNAGYASQVRDAIARKRADGHRFILLFAVREERVYLLMLS